MNRQLQACVALIAFGMLALSASAEQEKCPITGEAIDDEISLNVNGTELYFCCQDCPEVYQEKLQVEDDGPEECPVSGEPAKSDRRLVEISSAVSYFCCGNCPNEFAAENDFALVDNGPGECPISGQEADEAHTLVHNGETLYFCCGDCPEKYLSRIGVQDEGPMACPVSGDEALEDRRMIVTRAKAVYFCCGDCQEEYIQDEIAQTR